MTAPSTPAKDSELAILSVSQAEFQSAVKVVESLGLVIQAHEQILKQKDAESSSGWKRLLAGVRGINCVQMKLHRQSKKRKRQEELKSAADRRSETGIHKSRRERTQTLQKAFALPLEPPAALPTGEPLPPSEASAGPEPKRVFPKCYQCKVRMDEKTIHTFYDRLCLTCGTLNFDKRMQFDGIKGRWEGKTAVVTGGRIKIGFETALYLLRAGCTVIVTSRFIADASKRFAVVHDFTLRAVIHDFD